MHFGLEIGFWFVAVIWWVRVLAAWRGLPTVPDLLRAEYDIQPQGMPSITVIVPAKNEAGDVRGCLESLVTQDYANLQVVAVNDRSTDATGAIMDELAAAHPGRLRVMHIDALPAGWLGKTHAMATAALGVETDFLLFSDADILFAPQAIRRALVNATETRADHLVVLPTPITKRWDEAALLAFFQIFGLWAARPWKVADPRARDAIGIGAFNMIRTSAYRAIGGFEGFPMEIIEDLGLARRVKWAGLRQRVAFGQGLVRVHWATGMLGLVNVMTKNTFSAFNFHVPLLVLACGWLLVFCVGPVVALVTPGLWVPGLVALLAIAGAYGLMSRKSGLSAWNVLAEPFAAMLFVYTLLRSMVTTLAQGGVWWRGTFYSLKELRANTVPLLRR